MTTKQLKMRAAEEASSGRQLDSYPVRLFAHHMAEIFGVSLNAFYRADEAGAYLFAENRPRVGRKSWSRDRVRAWFDGTLTGLTERQSRMTRREQEAR